MAQMNGRDVDARESDNASRKEERRSSGSFKFNVSAPEFVPAVAHTPVQVPVAGYFYPYFPYVEGPSGTWVYVSDQEITFPSVQPKPNESTDSAQAQQQQQQLQRRQKQAKEIALSEELKQKIIKQAEYMFSDMSMLANETLVKHVNREPEGFVPINFVSTLKKLKSLNVNNQMVAQALRSSSKLVVSNDGKKVRRKQPFTEKEKEELQLRTVIAENLPDDHSHQKIETMFNVVGRIKSIRICQPQEHNPSRSSKGDILVSNKLHALVEYENSETAEKAAEKLNDERNWRKGMRVRLMLKRSVKVQPKSVLKSRKAEFDTLVVDDGSNHQSHEDGSHLSTSEAADADENSTALKRSWSRSREKSKQRPQLQSALSLPTPSSRSSSSCPGQPVKGPRMPDGTRGFTMGRGKPLAISVQSS